MENTEEIIEITVKVIFLGEFKDYLAWSKNYELCRQKYGVMAPILNYDCNGYATTGYVLRNFEKDTPYPVKTYLQVTNPGNKKTLAYKSPSNN
nr:hypothetical protein [uncultured Flavobacterium sp.]